jgi:glycosyltransferase involved in cell wall biosynthesis
MQSLPSEIPKANSVLSCVIVVENLPVPMDRRVWQEEQALRKMGWVVSVICPTSETHPALEEEIDGIFIYRHSLPVDTAKRMGFVIEYLAAFQCQTRLLFKLYWRSGFDVIQGCNPPDTIFLAALPYKLLGKRFVFDHHDLCPELFLAKFGKRGVIYNVLLWLERLTFLTADLVISANETYRQVAIARGAKSPSDVIAVYSVPDRTGLSRVEPNLNLRKGKRLALGYVGIIGTQDGLDHFVKAVHHLSHKCHRDDFQAIVVGAGPALSAAQSLAAELKVQDCITFTGYLTGEALRAALSAFDIGIIPDPINVYNDAISMNKVFEYSALSIPSVSYPLTETMRLLGDTGTYAKSGTPEELGEACRSLMDDDALRRERGVQAFSRLNELFDWKRESERYISFYERLLNKNMPRPSAEPDGGSNA